MKSVSGRRIASLAEAKGWTLNRTNGSHRTYPKADRTERVVIPIPGNRSLKTGLQRALMKLVPITEDEL